VPPPGAPQNLQSASPRRSVEQVHTRGSPLRSRSWTNAVNLRRATATAPIALGRRWGIVVESSRIVQGPSLTSAFMRTILGPCARTVR